MRFLSLKVGGVRQPVVPLDDVVHWLKQEAGAINNRQAFALADELEETYRDARGEDA